MQKVICETKFPKYLKCLIRIVLAGDRLEDAAPIKCVNDLCDPRFQSKIRRAIFDEDTIPDGIVKVPHHAFHLGTRLDWLLDLFNKVHEAEVQCCFLARLIGNELKAE